MWPALAVLSLAGGTRLHHLPPRLARFAFLGFSALFGAALAWIGAVTSLSPDRLAVAVLTGRTAADVAVRVRVGGIRYLGDHGLQSGTVARHVRAERLVAEVQPGHDASVKPAERFASRVPEILGRPAWLFVERKGPSVAFHVRQADDVGAARGAVLAAIATVEAAPLTDENPTDENPTDENPTDGEEETRG